MRIICFSTSEEQDTALRQLAPSQEFPTMSMLLRTIIDEFLTRRRDDNSASNPEKQ